ncbi:MAG: FMN-binding negative transcriptional regulator [Alphaproteobacteria bacterium]
MHPNRIFRGQAETEILEFSSEQAFGVLSMAATPFPLTSHVPFIITEDKKSVEFHLASNNPMRALLAEPAPVSLSVMGPHAYISPDWYGLEDQVPTWNYVATQICGHAVEMPKDWLIDHLDRLSTEMENRLLPKKPWTTRKMDAKKFKAMRNGIFGVKLEIEKLDGTWKLNQNKPAEARKGAANGLAEVNEQGSQQISALMKAGL